ncbi:MAG: 7,8-didemethyl-8-hydroxy-5-deazariboflavin synthase subunit CofG [Promethearchaeota archaeon]
MNFQEEIRYFKELSLRKLKKEIARIRGDLPPEKRKIITYSRNFTLSLSNYCQNQCGYCFYNFKVPKLSGEGNVVLLENEKMREIIQKGLEHDCKEALILSGDHPDSFKEVRDELTARHCHTFVEFVKDTCMYVLDFNILPHVNIGILTIEELKELKPYCASMGLMLESTSVELLKKGGVHEFSPSKHPKMRIEHIENAGKLKIPFTTGLLLGIGECFEDRVKDLLLIKKIHEDHRHIQEVILQNFEYKKGISYTPSKPLSMKDILRITGIARVIFQNEIAIQVPPNLIAGHEKDFIKLGINDFGGISPFDLDYINPEAPWPSISYLKKKCKQIGYELKERLPIYDKFINKKEFCTETIKQRIDNINLDVDYSII